MAPERALHVFIASVHFRHEYTYCTMNIVHLITVLDLGLFSICGVTGGVGSHELVPLQVLGLVPITECPMRH